MQDTERCLDLVYELRVNRFMLLFQLGGDATEDSDIDRRWFLFKIKHLLRLLRHLVPLYGLFKVLDNLLLVDQLDFFE